MQIGDEGEWTAVATLNEHDLTNYTMTDVDTSKPLRFKVQAWKYGSASDFSNVALADDSGSGTDPWILMDDFQQLIEQILPKVEQPHFFSEFWLRKQKPEIL